MSEKKFIFQVDAFTDQPFKGNPAGVCILNSEPDSGWMQDVAMEMNLSETAFVFQGKETRNIRFFTPEAEIDLCGHATLSASHILYERGIVREEQEIVLTSKAGKLYIRKNQGWITMNFPSYTLEKIAEPENFYSVSGKSSLEFYKTAHGWTLALLKNEEDVRMMEPDFQAMKETEFGDLIVTAPSDNKEFDFCVRCFAPALGINEDPVTGSAHCVLVPFWKMKTGKERFISHQISKREGILKVSQRGDRVEIAGQAITILKAEMYV